MKTTAQTSFPRPEFSVAEPTFAEFPESGEPGGSRSECREIDPAEPDISSSEELARRTFVILQEADLGSRRRPPSLYAVFQLYCVKEWTIPQIARKCRCSLGTVANRLDLLRRRVGTNPVSLRRVARQFIILDRDSRQAKHNYNRRLRSSEDLGEDET
jgi:hypothetical protein